MSERKRKFDLVLAMIDLEIFLEYFLHKRDEQLDIFRDRISKTSFTWPYVLEEEPNFIHKFWLGKKSVSIVVVSLLSISRNSL